MLAVSSGSAMRPLLLVLMNATRSSTEVFTISSFVVNSVRIASAVAPYLFEKGCSPLRSKAYSLNFRKMLFHIYVFSLAIHSVMCIRCLVRRCKARYWEPRQGLMLIRPTRAKSAITKESMPSFFPMSLKDFL